MAKTLFADNSRARLELHINRFMLLIALAAIISLILEHGRYVGPDKTQYLEALNVCIIAIFVLEIFAKLAIAPVKKSYLRTNLIDFVVIGALFVLPLAGILLRKYELLPAILQRIEVADIKTLYVRVIQAYIVYHIVRKGVQFQKAIAISSVRPAQILVFSYLAIIVLGTFLLFAPRATAGGERISLVDALFTATSATCVTGLVVQDTGSYFSHYGQMVILTLIQIGGLGLMTFTTFFSIIFSSRLGLREQVIMQDVMSYNILGKISRRIVYILVLTFVMEAIGAIVLYNVWTDPFISQGRRIYLSIFHAVSAFCNAGFCLYRDSFQGYQSNLILNLTVPLLVIIGGLGFAVHTNLFSVLKDKLLRKVRKEDALHRSASAPARISLHSKIVLIATAGLLILGFCLFVMLENDGILKNMSAADKMKVSFFQSVTPRTAGFSTVDYRQLKPATLFFTMMLMFIGASPGSTGGGIKTVTIAVLVLLVISVIRNRDKVEIGKKTVPRRNVNQATVVVVIALALVFVSCLSLVFVENKKGFTFVQMAFETFSALGTVGLSTGITGYLSSAGKVIIIITMLCGRIGPLFLALSLSGRAFTRDFDYPTEKVTIG